MKDNKTFILRFFTKKENRVKKRSKKLKIFLSK